MKKLIIVFAGLLTTGIAFSQNSLNAAAAGGKIKLADGQRIIVESTSDVQASLAMGIELNSNSTTVNALQVKSSTDKDYTIGNTLTKLKLNMNMMGQANNYDSDNKDGNNAEMAKVFDERLNRQVDVVIDNKTGTSLAENKKGKKAETADDTNPADELIKMFSDNSDDAIVSGAFEIIPKGKAVGDSWADTSTAKDSKIITTYTLRSVTGNEAVIQSNVVSTAVNKLNFQEMEFELKSETKTTGEILTDSNTGLVKKRTTTADITGSIQMMGQDMPISAKVITTSTYR